MNSRSQAQDATIGIDQILVLMILFFLFDVSGLARGVCVSVWVRGDEREEDIGNCERSQQTTKVRTVQADRNRKKTIGML